MATSGRPHYHHGDLRAELVRVAGEILDEDGAAELTLREAARRAGVSHSAPYRHFADREALLAELVARSFAQLGAALREAAPAGGAAVARAYLRFALERPRRYRLMYAEQAWSDRAGDRLAQLAPVLRVFAASVPDVGDADHVARAATAAWALLHGLAQLAIGGLLAAPADAADAERLVREVVGTLRFATKSAASA
jgi:AcrR family transcriptional regulator